MSIVAEGRNRRLWHLWNTAYLGSGADASDEGFILQTEQGWTLHAGGSAGRLRGTYATLDEAMRAAGVVRRRAGTAGGDR